MLLPKPQLKDYLPYFPDSWTPGMYMIQGGGSRTPAICISERINHHLSQKTRGGVNKTLRRSIIKKTVPYIPYNHHQHVVLLRVPTAALVRRPVINIPRRTWNWPWPLARNRPFLLLCRRPASSRQGAGERSIGFSTHQQAVITPIANDSHVMGLLSSSEVLCLCSLCARIVAFGCIRIQDWGVGDLILPPRRGENLVAQKVIRRITEMIDGQTVKISPPLRGRSNSNGFLLFQMPRHPHIPARP